MVKYLAFDASDSEIIVLGYNGKKYHEKRKKCSGTEHLIVLIDEVLKKLKMDISEVQVVACSVGPGSWTGARVGVVTAYGLASGNKNLKFVKFNAFDLISYNDSENEDKLYLVRAYANYVYVCSCKDKMKCITIDELNKIKEGKTLVSRGEVLKGVKPAKKLFIKEVVEDKINNGEYVLPEDLEPVYLRLSQAEYQLMEKKAKEKEKKND